MQAGRMDGARRGVEGYSGTLTERRWILMKRYVQIGLQPSSVGQSRNYERRGGFDGDRVDD